MSRDVEVWLGKTLQKLDSLLVQVCQEFQEEKYITVIDAYALIGDISGLPEKIQSFFMQSILSETHCILKIAVQEDEHSDDSQTSPNARLTLLARQMMDVVDQKQDDSSAILNEGNQTKTVVTGSCPWYELRRDAKAFASDTLRKRVQKCVATYSKSHFEAFCGVEASEFRSKLKSACENYFRSLNRQNMHVLKMVLKRENWQILPQDVIQTVSFAGLFGDGAPLLRSSGVTSPQYCHSINLLSAAEFGTSKSVFSQWIDNGNPFSPKLASPLGECETSPFLDVCSKETPEESKYEAETYEVSSLKSDTNHMNGDRTSEDENEDLLVDFIDEDSQQPSHTKPVLSRQSSWTNMQGLC